MKNKDFICENWKNDLIFRVFLKEKGLFIYSMTPLCAAVKGGNTEIVRLLLPLSDINQTSTDGTTPLHLAVRLGHSEITQMLLSDNRIDVNKPDVDGNTALHLAVKANQVACLELLLYYSRPISHL